MLLLITCIQAFPTYATHIRAGEIIAQLVDCQTLTYRFTVVGYEDTGSDVEFGNGELNYGDGEIVDLNTENVFFTRRIISNQDQIRVSEFITVHTFPGPGEYTITFREFNRNDDILNMVNSVNTPFYIETKIVIDPLSGCNNSPVLLIPPVDKGCTGVPFLHNPGAYDPDGDSISYKMVIPKKDRDQDVDGYQLPPVYDVNSGANPDPIKQDGSFPPTLTLDSITGDIVWDAPGNAGEYNIAFIIEEWRLIGDRWVKLGHVTRDMQIIVEECDNEPPVVTVPVDTCLEAGSLLEATVSAEDPDNDKIFLEAFGGVFELPSSPATFIPKPPPASLPSPVTGQFSWQTNCTHIRTRPYQVEIKAADDPASGPSLVDFKTWNIYVVGPAPTGLMAESAIGKSINLNWDSYLCEAQADRIQIWRRVDEFEFEADNCQTGIPSGGEYELVAEVDAGVVSFKDDNNGEGLDPGVTYCYRLVAVFPLPEGGESYASEEACAIMEANAPVITKVSIEETSKEQGVIDVSWMGPFQIDSALFPAPYSYDLLRATAFSGNAEIQNVASGIQDTVFTDTGLNTQDQVYNYRIVFYDANGQLIDTSAVASSVRLEPAPLVGSIRLNWQADVPWSNSSQDYPFHYIYRNRVAGNDAGTFVLIDSVNAPAEGFTYLDEGEVDGQPLSDQLEYCYYITTQGSYGNELIVAPLLNNSQKVCAQPNDTIPPCMPMRVSIPNADINDCESLLEGKPCDFNQFFNTITWQRDPSDCDSDVGGYNVYFSFTGEEGSFEKVKTVTDTFYVDGPLASFAGCYRISAVDRSGNESELSEPICNDNCPSFELPNVFTPNADGENDVFRAYNKPEENKCPRFVKSVSFTVFNRWGKEIRSFQSGPEQSILINWDGRDEEGQLVPPGVYYYTADVQFIWLDPNRGPRQYKGWVHVMF